MEAAGAKILYQRSLTRGLHYIPFIGDRDSKAYSAVTQDQLYGPNVYILKEECVSHVTKRMGTGLRALLKDHKSNNTPLKFDICEVTCILHSQTCYLPHRAQMASYVGGIMMQCFSVQNQ